MSAHALVHSPYIHTRLLIRWFVFEEVSSIEITWNLFIREAPHAKLNIIIRTLLWVCLLCESGLGVYEITKCHTRKLNSLFFALCQCRKFISDCGHLNGLLTGWVWSKCSASFFSLFTNHLFIYLFIYYGNQAYFPNCVLFVTYFLNRSLVSTLFYQFSTATARYVMTHGVCVCVYVAEHIMFWLRIQLNLISRCFPPLNKPSSLNWRVCSVRTCAVFFVCFGFALW